MGYIEDQDYEEMVDSEYSHYDYDHFPDYYGPYTETYWVIDND